MLGRIGLYAAMLAAAGVPLYIHLPRYASVELGLSLSTLGAVLLGIRVMDFAQDPLLGWLTDRDAVPLKVWAAIGAIGLGGGFWALFAMTPLGDPVTWLALVLVLIFTSYSLLTILFYGQGVRLMHAKGARAHYRLAGAREAGTVAGILLATILPTALGYQGFAFVYLGLVGLAAVAMSKLWNRAGAPSHHGSGLWGALQQRRVRFLLLLGLVNALPVAITSTLFLFFVEDKLGLVGKAGPFLLVFFASAGATAPLWSKAAQRWEARSVLLVGMGLAIVSFAGVVGLPVGAQSGFFVICIASGAALGADMVLLPALFSVALDEEEVQGGAGFGLWSLVTKMALALAAAVTLPTLENTGFIPSGDNSAEALWTLTLCYAILPCFLKVAAVGLVLLLPRRVREG